jgi:transposase InsO family protein
VKYAFVARERTRFPVVIMCRVLDVSVSGFYAFQQRKADPKPDPDAALRDDLRTIHEGSRRTYGRPRMVRALRACAHKVGPKRIARLMREEGLRGVRKRGFKPNTTNSRHSREVAPNLLDRQFAVAADTAAWASDITYLPTREGWLYLAVILSLRTRQVVGYSLADRMPDNLVQQALLNAYATNPAEPGTLFHSDRGSQYASNDFRNTLKPLGFVPSMSRKGNCWDNAVAESFFATLKAEEATGVYETKTAAHHAIASYIHGFYNPIRLHSSLDYLSPNDFARKLNSAALRRAS